MIALPTDLAMRGKYPTTPHRGRGFSLVELTIVLIIVALLASGLMVGISAQRNVAENLAAERQLENIREALLGFAMTKGRLPCPALPTLPSTDNAAGTEDCSSEHGVLPWATLGLPETDPWGNRFSYFAASGFTGSLTGGAIASFTLETDGTAEVKDSVSAGNNIALALPAVVVCHGSNGAGAHLPSGSKLADGSDGEVENSHASNRIFISHAPMANPYFDDLIVWIVPAILKSRMVAAGRLP